MRVVLIALAALAGGGCSTIVKGTSQAVAVNVNGPSSAECEINSPAFGAIRVRAPGSATLPLSKHSPTVRCQADGYADGSAVIASKFQAMTAGNILIGGVIGVAVDASTGAMNRYEPNVTVNMSPIGRPQKRFTPRPGSGGPAVS